MSRMTASIIVQSVPGTAFLHTYKYMYDQDVGPNIQLHVNQYVTYSAERSSSQIHMRYLNHNEYIRFTFDASINKFH